MSHALANYTEEASPARRVRGVALISVLLIVAIVSALVYHLLERHSLVVAQTRQTLSGSQALEYALGAEAYGRQLLAEDWTNDESRSFDALTEPWAQPLEPFEIEDGYLEVWIEDLQGKFNLNALTGTEVGRSMQRFKDMLSAAGVEPDVADQWKDWVDADQDVSGFGAEDGDYLLSDPPHRTSNQRAADKSELRWLKNVDADVYAKIEALVVALPSSSLKINVNTASGPALIAISARLPPSTAEALVQSAREFTSVQSVNTEIPEFADAGDVVAVTSNYFEIHARAEVHGARTDLASIVHRDPQTGRVTLLSRDLGRTFVSKFVPVDAKAGDGDAS